MTEHLFELTWLDVPRTTTRSEWKMISRYLRTCRRLVEESIDLKKISKAIQDCCIFGTGSYELIDAIAKAGWKRPT